MIEKYSNLCKDYYFQEHRKFHNWGHIEFGLDVFSKLNKGTPEQKISWLFHDIVYKPAYANNELESSILAIEHIKNNKDDIFLDIKEVSTIILDTKEHIPTIESSKLVLDIDMAILGIADYHEFFHHRILAAKEFSHFGYEAVVTGTKKFIEKTLNQSIIYYTPDFKDYETNARLNLEQFYVSFENDVRFTSLFNELKHKMFIKQSL